MNRKPAPLQRRIAIPMLLLLTAAPLFAQGENSITPTPAPSVSPGAPVVPTAPAATPVPKPAQPKPAAAATTRQRSSGDFDSLFEALGISERDLNRPARLPADVPAARPNGVQTVQAPVTPNVEPLVPAPPLPPDSTPAGLLPPPLVPDPATLAPVTPAPAAGPEAAPPEMPKIATAEQQNRKAANRAETLMDEISPRRISITDAVRMALAANPDIELSVQDVNEARAILQQAQGEFDTRLNADIDYENRQRESSDKEKLKEQSRYRAIKELYDTSRILQDQLRKIKAGAPLSTLDYEQTPLGSSGSTISNPDNSLEVEADQKLEDAAGEKFAELDKLLADNIDKLVGLGFSQQQINEVDQKVRESILAQKAVFRELETRTYNSLRREPPWSVTRTETLRVQVGLLKHFRGGGDLQLYARSNNSETNFQRRARNAPENRSNVGGELAFNLTKLGLGDLATAQEQASKEVLRAREQSALANVSRRILEVVRAYWALAAAQERLERFALAEQQNIVATAVTSLMIEAKILPAVDVVQTRARAQQTAADVFGAQIEVATAQQALAILIGLPPEDVLHAPLAADPLPDPLAEDEISNADYRGLYRYALQSHPDLVAFRYLKNSDSILVEQARRDLLPDFRVNVGAEWTGYREDSGVNGILGTYTSNQTGASVLLGAQFDWPIENNFRKGAFLDARTQANKTVLQEDGARREAASRIALARSRLLIAARQYRDLEAAVGFLAQVVANEREKLRLRSGSVINVISSEQNLTFARVNAVTARQVYAQALADLRYDTFTLLPPHNLNDLRYSRTHFRVTPDMFTTLPSPRLFVPRPAEPGATQDVIFPRPVLDRVFNPEPDRSASPKLPHPEPPLNGRLFEPHLVAPEPRSSGRLRVREVPPTRVPEGSPNAAPTAESARGAKLDYEPAAPPIVKVSTSPAAAPRVTRKTDLRPLPLLERLEPAPRTVEETPAPAPSKPVATRTEPAPAPAAAPRLTVTPRPAAEPPPAPAPSEPAPDGAPKPLLNKLFGR